VQLPDGLKKDYELLEGVWWDYELYFGLARVLGLRYPSLCEGLWL
jgi:hypothetical protein